MRTKAEMAVALRDSRGTFELKKFGPDLPAPARPIGFVSGGPASGGFASDQPATEGAALHIGPFVADKYALLLKYSDKARAAEARLSTLPDDLRERFRQEAVADPGRIEEIASTLVAEGRKRLNPFGDPVLNALYRKLGSHGFEAQAEFLQVLELLKGQVDPEKVFARIIEDHPAREAEKKSRSAARREVAPVPRPAETAEEIEQRRRRAEKIAREIVGLRRAFEDRHLSGGPETSKEGDGPAGPAEPAVLTDPSTVSRRSSDAAATAAVVPAMPRKSSVAAGALAWQPKWGSVAAVAVAMLAASGAAWKLSAPSPGTVRTVHASPVAQPQQPIMPREAATPAAATDATVAEAARKAAEEKLAAEATRRDEEARKAQQEQEEQQAAIEAARQMAEAQGRAAAHEAAQRELAEAAPEPGQAPPVAVVADSAPKPVADARQAEKAEAALSLSEQDRKRVQAALTALGHEVPATGYFGPITRKMIAAWQKTQGLPETGFLDRPQFAALTVQATPAPDPAEQAKHDARQAESALNLSEQDRKRVQAALTALGHEVPATGYFGPITRKMIAAWQKTQGLPETGFLDRPQFAALTVQATPAPDPAEQAKHDARQAESALNLSEQDRKRVQAALTALGHEVPATGYFGPITRKMIAAWQKTQGLPETGFLDPSQLAALTAQARERQAAR
jgi:peptidoglycan hydrolase-like protein with peptidoglycan-binding domain